MTTFLFTEHVDLPELQDCFCSLVNYLLATAAEPQYTLEPDELREWAWGSVHGAVPVGFVPFSFS
jgi:hypothetical protein